jgi:abhydrolase domain-containing protein 17
MKNPVQHHLGKLLVSQLPQLLELNLSNVMGMSVYELNSLTRFDLSDIPTWKRAMGLLLFIYCCLGIYIFVRADSMMFFPQPASYQDTQDILKIPVTASERISAVYLPNSQAKYTLLYVHGNAEDLGDIRSRLDRLHGLGFSVFAYDYRGYGTSNGTPGERNAYGDADAAYTYLTQQLKIPPTQIIVYGRSIGGGSATELVTRHATAGLILESTFTSAFRVILPFPLLPFDKFTNLDKLPKVRFPVLVMHGENDRTIPIAHGRKLYEAASAPKISLWVQAAGHNDLAEIAGKRYDRVLLSFQGLIDTHLASKQSY